MFGVLHCSALTFTGNTGGNMVILKQSYNVSANIARGHWVYSHFTAIHHLNSHSQWSLGSFPFHYHIHHAPQATHLVVDGCYSIPLPYTVVVVPFHCHIVWLLFHSVAIYCFNPHSWWLQVPSDCHASPELVVTELTLWLHSHYNAVHSLNPQGWWL